MGQHIWYSLKPVALYSATCLITRTPWPSSVFLSNTAFSLFAEPINVFKILHMGSVTYAQPLDLPATPYALISLIDVHACGNKRQVWEGTCYVGSSGSRTWGHCWWRQAIIYDVSRKLSSISKYSRVSKLAVFFFFDSLDLCRHIRTGYDPRNIFTTRTQRKWDGEAQTTAFVMHYNCYDCNILSC